LSDLQELTEKIIEFRDKRGWGKHHLPKNMAIGLLMEASEFLEIFQWTKHLDAPQGKREDLADELMDVLYWVLLIAHELNIDIKKAFASKMEKNKKKYPLTQEE